MNYENVWPGTYLPQKEPGPRQRKAVGGPVSVRGKAVAVRGRYAKSYGLIWRMTSRMVPSRASTMATTLSSHCSGSGSPTME